MSQEWADQDYYGILEVAPDVDAAGLKRAYRRLAHAHHPDSNRGDPRAGQRFAAIAFAYGVLSDPAQRDAYDQVRSSYPAQEPAQSTREEPFGGSFAGSVLGRHIITTAVLPLEQAAVGATVIITLDDGREIRVGLPVGVDDGDIIRLEGKGQPAIDGGKAGDLIVIVHVPRHQLFERDGMDLTTRVSVGLSQAAMGGDIVVPSLTGPVTITLPPGTRIGARFRLDGRGIPSPDGHPGDLYVVLQPDSGEQMRSDARRGSFAGLVDVLDDEMEVIPTVGRPFDPELHEAVRVAGPGAGPLVVTGEVRRGYRVKGQVIRPALVTVAHSEVESLTKRQIEEGTRDES